MASDPEKQLAAVSDTSQLSQRPPVEGEIPKRKPVPTAVVTSDDSSSSTEFETGQIVVNGAVEPSTTHQPWWDWKQFSKKKKRIVLAGIIAGLCLLALIIGLAVGLTRHGKGSSNLPLPTTNGGPYEGDLTYYEPGLGSCGITSTADEMICAVSHVLFDAASISSNPNENPLCGLRVRIHRGDKSVDVTIVDRCVGCVVDDLDVSPAVFEKLAQLAEGRVLMEWSWIDNPPASVQ